MHTAFYFSSFQIQAHGENLPHLVPNVPSAKPTKKWVFFHFLCRCGRCTVRALWRHTRATAALPCSIFSFLRHTTISGHSTATDWSRACVARSASSAKPPHFSNTNAFSAPRGHQRSGGPPPPDRIRIGCRYGTQIRRPEDRKRGSTTL